MVRLVGLGEKKNRRLPDTGKREKPAGTGASGLRKQQRM
jgi:hypothetical protein